MKKIGKCTGCLFGEKDENGHVFCVDRGYEVNSVFARSHHECYVPDEEAE